MTPLGLGIPKLAFLYVGDSLHQGLLAHPHVRTYRAAKSHPATQQPRASDPLLVDMSLMVANGPVRVG